MNPLTKLNTKFVAHIGLTILALGLNAIATPEGLNHALSFVGIQLSGHTLGYMLSVVGGILAYLGKPSTAPIASATTTTTVEVTKNESA